MFSRSVFLAGFLLCIGVGVAAGQPQYLAGTGHYYELVHPTGSPTTHSGNKADVQNRQFLGLQGHLATVTGDTENDFLASWLKRDRQTHAYRLGGIYTSGQWSWETGETWSYTNWASGEPSFSVPGDQELMMYGPHPEIGKWNDSQYGVAKTDWGYIIEYDVPEPATLSLLTIGGLALIRRWK